MVVFEGLHGGALRNSSNEVKDSEGEQIKDFIWVGQQPRVFPKGAISETRAKIIDRWWKSVAIVGMVSASSLPVWERILEIDDI